MKYDEAIVKLKNGWQLRYTHNGLIGGERVHIGDEDWNEEEQLHPMTIKKILKNHKYKFRSVWMDGNNEGGIIDLYFN